MLQIKSVINLPPMMRSICCSVRNNIMISNVSSHSVGTVDEGDIRRHANLATDWWNVNGPMKALHSLNQIRCINFSQVALNIL